MENLKSICVYCGASNNVDTIYRKAAEKLGNTIGSAGKRLIYGGGHSGLMGIVADSVLESGGEAIGIIPKHLQDREVKHTSLTKLHITPDMHTRKKMMMDYADAYVVLAGGLGTLEEFFEILTWKQLQIHAQPIIIVNIDGYWDKIIETIDHIIGKGFAKPADKKLFTVINDPSELMGVLAETEQPNLKAHPELM